MLQDLIDLAKLYLQKWFGSVKITQRGNSISISRQYFSDNAKLLARSLAEHTKVEAFDNEDLINSILNEKLEKALSNIFTEQLINDAITNASVRFKAKELIGKSILKRVERDASAIVDEALGDLEDNYDITNAVREHTIKRIKGVFK